MQGKPPADSLLLRLRNLFVRGGKKGRYTRDLLQGEHYDIGAFTYGKPEVFGLNQGARLKIGKYCSFAGGVKIFLGDNHRLDWLSTFPFPAFADDWPAAAGNREYFATKGDVVIGSDVWVGQEAFLLSGVNIGHGAVIGARAVVASDIEPYAVAVGNPARVIRRRFSDAAITRLLELAWWDWPEAVIREHVHILCSGDLDALAALAALAAQHTTG